MSNNKETTTSSTKVDKVQKDMQNLQLSDAEMAPIKSEEEDSPMHSDDSDDSDYQSSEQGYSDDEDLAKADAEEAEADNPEAEQIAKVIQDVINHKITKYKNNEDILKLAAEEGFETDDVELIVEASGVLREIIDGLKDLVPNPSADHIVSLLAAYAPSLKNKTGNFAWFGKNALAEDYMTIASKTGGNGEPGLEALLSENALGNVWVDGDDGRGVISIVKLARAFKARA